MLDQRLAEAQAHQLKVLYTFSNTPEWCAQPISGVQPGLPSPTGNLPPDYQAWGDFVMAIVTHAGDKIQVWELFNECNYAGFWAGDYPTLLAMCELAYDVIKSAYPHAIVLTPSVTYSWAGNNVLTALPQLLDLGFQNFADGIAIHGYLVAGAPATVIGSIIDAVHILRAKHNLSMGLWDVEWGYGTQSLTNDQKAQFVKDGLTTRLYGGVAAAIWYQFDNATHGTMVSTDGSLTPAGQAWMQTFNSWHA
jgi:hypothetical protein